MSEVSPPVWEDPRVVAGMEEQLERRRRALGAGERAIGWKLAFGTEQAKESLGISGPAVGFLTSATLVESGASVSLDGWTKPMFEAEIGIYLGADVPAGADAGEAAEAIEALGPAIELADVDAPPERLQEVLAGDLYHRRVILGPLEERRHESGADDLRVAVWRGGEQVGASEDPEGAVGRPAELVAHAASYLGAFGQQLRAGEVVISGSTVPLIPIAPGQRLRYELAPIGEVAVELVGEPALGEGE